jgi:phosphohistidine swiveling domain-containing protein
MAKLKILQRKYINKLLYPPSILDGFIEEINSRLDLKYPITTYGFRELIDLLVGKKVRVPNRSGYVLTGSLFHGKEIIGEKAKEIFSQLLDIKADRKYISGSVAHPGYYRGRVKKIDFSIRTDYIREIASMQKGDVLVSGSTGPEMILACKKAGAIVTDEGGIISHAALISRELAIPCVIGTSIATRILKDGDLVEVDANKGIIHINPRKQSR